MKIPEYITVEEVRRVCKELKIRDWTKMKDSKVLLKEARIILAQVNTAGMKINLEDFRKGLVIQNHDKSFIGRGSFALTGVDVYKAFNSFHNFGQDFLKAENIAGSLSGNISLILSVDSLLNPNINLISAEGKYVLTNGSLINFDPVKALSKFIELSELENIKFDKLENDFFIRNNVFYVPQIDIKSSAVDLSVNGKHSFDNEYQYHVKMLLSEILSNKARKNRTFSDKRLALRDGLCPPGVRPPCPRTGFAGL